MATKRTQDRKAKARTTALAVIEPTPLEREFERIIAEMHAGFDAVQKETEANLDRIGDLTDFGTMREGLVERLDNLEDAVEAAVEAERKRPAEDVDDTRTPEERALAEQVAFVGEQEALASTTDYLATWAAYARSVSEHAAAVNAASGRPPQAQ